MSTGIQEYYDLWSKDNKEILKLPNNRLLSALKAFYKINQTSEEKEHKFMKSINDHVENKLSALISKNNEIRIGMLEDANQFTPLDLVLNLALNGVGGAIVGKLTKMALTKILGNRQLIGQTIISSSFSIELTDRTKQIQFNRYKKNLSRISVKGKYHEARIVDDIDLSPTSWQSLLINHVPDIFNSRAETLFQKVPDLKGKKEHKSVVIKDYTDYFSHERLKLDDKISESEIQLTFTILNIENEFNEDISKKRKLHYISLVKNHIKFISNNKVNLRWRPDKENEMHMRAQPLLISLILNSFLIPSKTD